jgi:hypothetical protein
MLELSHIFAEFQKLPVSEKVSYLEALESLNPNFDINFNNLKEAWDKIARREAQKESETINL